MVVLLRQGSMYVVKGARGEQRQSGDDADVRPGRGVRQRALHLYFSLQGHCDLRALSRQ